LNDTNEELKIKDKDLLIKFQEIQNMTGKTKEAATTLIDLVIHDFKASLCFLKN